MALPRALRSRERPRPGHRPAPGSVYYQQLLLLSPARLGWPQPTASPGLRLLPPLPPFPASTPQLRSGCRGSRRFRSHPPRFTDPGWGASGEGAGGRSGNWESTDGALPRGVPRLQAGGRAGVDAASDPEGEPEAEGRRTLGVTCGARDPGLPGEVRGVRALGRFPRKYWGRSRRSTTSLGTLTQRSPPGSRHPLWQVWLGKETVAGGPKGSDGS